MSIRSSLDSCLKRTPKSEEAPDGEVIDSTELEDQLDPEVLERRDAALAQVRKFGDPVLKSPASPVTDFDEGLEAEIARMVAIMSDGLGVGLAATQLGIMHRVLVLQAGHDAPATALVNPLIEWLSEETETMEEGCLSLPGVIVDVERPLQARVTAFDAHGEPLTIEASGPGGARDPARGRPPRRRADPRPHRARAAQAGAAGAARGPLLAPGRIRTGRNEPESSLAAALRTVYLGTSQFAAAVLRRLADSPHRPQLVVTPPDRPKGRGRKLASPPAAEAARELGIELLQAANGQRRRTPSRRSARRPPRLVVVCAFGQLIGAELLAGPPILNVHPSLLPRWRGAAPIERAMIAGDAETGVSIMRIGEGLDDGPVALRESVAIEPGEDFAALAARLAELGGELLVRALELQAAAEIEFEEQDDAAATYAEKIEPDDRRLDPRRPAAELERRVRALTPHVGAYLELGGGERLGVRRDARPAAPGSPASSARRRAARSSSAAPRAPCASSACQAAGQTRDGRRRVPPGARGSPIELAA